MESTYQQYTQTNQNGELTKYKTNIGKHQREILELQREASMLRSALKRDAELTQLKRSPSVSISKPILTRNTLKRKTSFQITSTQTRHHSSQQDIEFSIIELESLTVGIKCEILHLEDKYTEVQITNEQKKSFIKCFMTHWRRIDQLDSKYQTLFSELPSTHEYLQNSSTVKNWLGSLRTKLWNLREDVNEKSRIYEERLKRKQEEQELLLEQYFGNHGTRGIRNSTSRNYVTSPVDSEFGSDISNFSSGSCYSSTSS